MQEKYEVDLSSSNFDTFVQMVLMESSNKTLYTHPFLFMKAYQMGLVDALSEEMKACLRAMKEGLSPGIIHIKGFPQDHILPSDAPAVERNQSKTRVSEAIILATAALLGCYLYSKKTEQDGVIVHNISPVKGKESVVSSVGLDPFYYHTEIAYASAVPKFLMLFCLEGDLCAKTSYFFIKTILQNIPEAIKATMRKPVFKVSAVAGYDQDEIITPLLHLDPQTGQETFRFYQKVDRLEAAPRFSEEADEVTRCLTFLTAHASLIFPAPGEEPSVGLNPGEALLFNNGWSATDQHHGVMHGRVGRIENKNRWLQRGYFFDITPDMQHKISRGYGHFLKHAIKNYPLKTAADLLKTAIKHTPEYKACLDTHPEYTESQLFFHSVGAKKSKRSWLNQLARRSETDDLMQINHGV
jgi:alpha-ketoglutarate-dependent taurine dioxygenase